MNDMTDLYDDSRICMNDMTDLYDDSRICMRVHDLYECWFYGVRLQIARRFKSVVDASRRGLML